MIDAETAETSFLAAVGGDTVSAILTRPANASALLVMGHGSGTPIHRPAMALTAAALAERGIAMFRFNYPYSEAGKAERWQQSLDPLDVLLATVDSVVTKAVEIVPDLPMFVGGRSMSSQVVSLAVAQGRVPSARGVVLFAFHLTWRQLLDDPVAHLQDIHVPLLFGDRDHLTALGELKSALKPLGSRVSLHVMTGTDHFFGYAEESRTSSEEEMREVAEAVGDWVSGLL